MNGRCQSGIPGLKESFIMKLGKAHCILAPIVALFSMLFAQLAVAAYACPGLTMSAVAKPAAMAGMSMSDCAQLVQEKADLCRIRPTFSQRSAAKPSSADRAVPPGTVRIFLRPAPMPGVAAPTAPGLYRVTSPPLAIRYCRFIT